MSIQVCAGCHKPSNKDDLFEDLCKLCISKEDKKVSKFDSENWVKYIKQLLDREWTYDQIHCKRHQYLRVPKSGKYLGISLWKCVYCDGVVQST